MAMLCFWMKQSSKSNMMKIAIDQFKQRTIRQVGLYKPDFWQISVSRVEFSPFHTWLAAVVSHKTLRSWIQNLQILWMLSFQIDRNGVVYIFDKTRGRQPTWIGFGSNFGNPLSHCGLDYINARMADLLECKILIPCRLL